MTNFSLSSGQTERGRSINDLCGLGVPVRDRILPPLGTSIAFGTNHFNTNNNFPLEIDPLQIGAININCTPQNAGEIMDTMIIHSENLLDDLEIELSALVVDDNVLYGNLSGIIPSNTYRVTGDITIEAGDTLVIEPGTELLFNGEYSFTINGILKANASELDSIIFDNFNDNSQNRWKGIVLNNQTSETYFEYVRITGVNNDVIGGAIYLYHSDPIMYHMTISENIAEYGSGGGLYLYYSNPNLAHIKISHNLAKNH